MSASKVSGRDTEADTYSEHEQEEIRKTEAAWDRLRRLIPDTPFLLTVSQDPKAQYYHYSRQDAESYMLGNLFGRDEEHVQYSTFLYREYGESCFNCRSEVDEERDRQKRSKRGSSPDPFVEKKTMLEGSGSGKKVSLGAYLSKKAGLNGASAAPTISNEPKSTKSANTITKMNGIKSSGDDPTKETASSSSRGQKRSLDNTLEVKQPTSSRVPNVASVTKKPRLSPDTHTKKKPGAKSTTTEQNPHNLPPLLSPTILPDYDLPPLLSPTLPTNIEEELDKIATEQRQRAVSDASSSSGKRPVGVRSPLVKAQDAASSMGVKSDGKKTDAKPPIPDLKPSSSAQKAPLVSKTKLIVKLRYGRRHRKEVERYLKLPQSGRPAAPEIKKARPSAGFSTKDKLSTAPVIKKISVSGKHPVVAHDAELPSQSSSDKRPRDEDSQPPLPSIKRHKSSTSLDMDNKPRTPAQPAASSPALSNPPSAQKYLTPVKENKNLNMVRSSSDQGTTLTPGRSSTTPVGSSAKTAESKATSTSAPSANRKLDERAAWSNLSKKLNNQGRSLKHESQRLTQNSSGKMAPGDMKKCAVLSLECIFAYMAAYTCMDYSCRAQHRTPEVEHTWKTLLPLWEEFKRYTKPYPHLEGLRLSLGVAMYSRISVIVSQRANLGALGGSKPEQAPTPGSTATDSNSDANFELLAKSFQRMMGAASTARVLLPSAVIMEEYPRIWSQRAGNAVELGEWESLPPGDLRKDGAFQLPLGADTTPLMCVRFGFAFVNEWMKKEGMKYQMQFQF